MMEPMTTSRLIITVSALLVGIVLGQIVRADAQSTPKPFRECVAARTWEYSGSDVNDGEPFKKTLMPPPSWTPIGGGGLGSDG